MPNEIEQLINELEKDIDRLHALYNQYFMGIEKVEPSIPRKNLNRKINLLRREQIQNTAIRFRLQMQIQKYNTQSTYWNRICRQIENGTYNRQVMLAKRRVKARHKYSEIPPARSSAPPPRRRKSDLEEAFHIDLDEFGMDISDPLQAVGLDADPKAGISRLDDPFADILPSATSPNNDAATPLESAKPRPPIGAAARKSPIKQGPPETPVKPPPVPAHSKQTPPRSPVDPEHLKTIYRRYLAARKKCNEPTGELTFNLVAESLKRRIRSADGKVDFKVVIRDGKAVIKTVKTVKTDK